MRILLDEDVPVKLRHAFPSSFVVETVTYRGWDSLDNGALWEQAQQEFDAIVTLDRGVTDQRNLDRYTIGRAREGSKNPGSGPGYTRTLSPELSETTCSLLRYDLSSYR
jgi:hypothetical protein